MSDRPTPPAQTDPAAEPGADAGKKQPPEAKKPAGAKEKPRPFFMKQANMRRMIYALLPLVAAAVYFFGWRVLAVLAVVHALGIGTEWLTSRQRGQAVSMACLVTCLLYGLSLPPGVPYWIAGVGIVVGILFGKEVFGGFGRNFANPAIVARAFVYLSFPTALTAQFVPVFNGFPAGLAQWSWRSRSQLPAYIVKDLGQDAAGAKVSDAVSQATPMKVRREGGFVSPDDRKDRPPLGDLFLGTIGGTYREQNARKILSAGSMGEACAALILLSAIYLLVTKTANWRLMLSTLVGLTAATLLLRNVLGFDGLDEVAPIEFALLAGATLYVTVFMVTDPISAPRKPTAMYAYGFFIGFLIVLLRWKGVFVTAESFAILLGNMVGPLLDIGADAWEARKKARASSDRGAQR